MSKSLLRVGLVLDGGLFGSGGLLIFAKTYVSILKKYKMSLKASNSRTNFLEASPDNKLIAMVIGERKREGGLVFPAKHVALTKNITLANVL